MKNLKDWKTTIPALTGGLVAALGFLYPDKINPSTGGEIQTAMSEICIGVGIVISVVTGILARG